MTAKLFMAVSAMQRDGRSADNVATQG